jgi:hypothetical protein
MNDVLSNLRAQIATLYQQGSVAEAVFVLDMATELQRKYQNWVAALPSLQP